MSIHLKIDDNFETSYKYQWGQTKESELSLKDYLGKYRPSMVQNDGTKPWIWVQSSRDGPTPANETEACEEGYTYLKEVTEKVQAIQNDASIPTRSNKKTGAKSKKELREQIQAEATTKLKEISIKHNYVCGKWLLFASPDKVDAIWSSIATSLISGPLSSTCAWLAKVSTTPQEEQTHPQHIICVYMPDIYNQESVTEVMKVLLRNHGAALSGVKSDLYTTIGLDSKHPSGVSSTVWKNTGLLKDTEIKELKDEFFSNLSANKSKSDEASASGDKGVDVGKTSNEAKPEEDKVEIEDTSAKAKAKSKLKPKLKKKGADDPFASDGDEQEEEQKRKQTLKTKKANAAKRNKVSSDDEEPQEEDDEPKPKRTRRVPSRK